VSTFEQQAELAYAKGNDGIERDKDVALHRKVLMFCNVLRGPFGITRTCTICGHFEHRKSGRGRGSGMREGNKQRGKMYQHIKAEHPEFIEWLAKDG